MRQSADSCFIQWSQLRGRKPKRFLLHHSRYHQCVAGERGMAGKEAEIKRANDRSITTCYRSSSDHPCDSSRLYPVANWNISLCHACYTYFLKDGILFDVMCQIDKVGTEKWVRFFFDDKVGEKMSEWFRNSKWWVRLGLSGSHFLPLMSFGERNSTKTGFHTIDRNNKQAPSMERMGGTCLFGPPKIGRKCGCREGPSLTTLRMLIIIRALERTEMVNKGGP